MEPWTPEWKMAVQEAMWDNDHETLDTLAQCDCCCDEHTFESCPARYVGDCKGQGTLTWRDIDGWREYLGMTQEQFYPSHEDEWRKYAESLYGPVEWEHPDDFWDRN